MTDVKGPDAGRTVGVDVSFKTGDYVDVQGVTKGRGFAGVMKRHNFRGLPASHGASPTGGCAIGSRRSAPTARASRSRASCRGRSAPA